MCVYKIQPNLSTEKVVAGQVCINIKEQRTRQPRWNGKHRWRELCSSLQHCAFSDNGKWKCRKTSAWQNSVYKWPHCWTPGADWLHRYLCKQAATRAASHINSGRSHWDHRKVNSRLEKCELKNAHRTPPRPQPPTHCRPAHSWWSCTAGSYRWPGSSPWPLVSGWKSPDSQRKGTKRLGLGTHWKR